MSFSRVSAEEKDGRCLSSKVKIYFLTFSKFSFVPFTSVSLINRFNDCYSKDNYLNLTLFSFE